MPANNIVWTQAMTARLLRLLEQGMSYLGIAKTISGEFNVKVSKNACIGKGRRLQVPLRMPARKSVCQRRGSPKEAAPRKGLRRSARRSRPNPRKRKLRAQSTRSRKRREQPSPRRDLTLLQLSTTSCRWPSGDSPNITFCGDHQATGSSYCLKHTLIAIPGYGRSR